MNAFFTSLFVDSAYPACKPQSWIKQIFENNQSDDSEVCTETNQFVFTHIDGHKLESIVKGGITCKSSSQCNSDEYCSLFKTCRNKNDECAISDNSTVPCTTPCASSKCVSLGPSITHCCPLLLDKHNKVDRVHKTCENDTECGSNHRCRANGAFIGFCEDVSILKVENETEELKMVNAQRRYHKTPLSNFVREAHRSCSFDTLKPTPLESELCPGNPIPVGHEQKCFGAVLEFDKSGRCLHPAGTCYKGYCCPIVNQHHDSLPRKPYVTRVDCASFCPLPPDWLYAFCDPITKKVAFIGLELSYSNQKHRDYFWKDEPKYCETNEDCENEDVCVTTENWDESIESLSSSSECWSNPLRPPNPSGPESYISIGYFMVFSFVSLLAILSSLSKGKRKVR
ncbi:unnamed protein product [Caenorhabditis brenneri]